ncbi:MAG: response regulator transcription factor [Kiritimatiellia bacterium]|jgi:DNA-binding NarL/FixJ family response regulator|nr:response regulator transcription factor [Kiritimatiellia bacterium]MDP6847929.1 response regulator transcription factor [Kiritimatiellia bacterium]
MKRSTRSKPAVKKGTARAKKATGEEAASDDQATICTVSSVLLVDDHPVVRQGLREIIRRENDFEVCGEAEEATQALAMFEDLLPDVAIVDISLGGKSGIDLIKDMRALGVPCRILVLSVHAESTYAERALHAGANGYILKQDAPRVVIDGLRRILSGEIYVSDRLAPKLLARLATGRPADFRDAPISSLSDRELDVLELLGRGVGTREIAERLRLSVSTVETHRANIKIKLNIDSASALVSFATEWLLSQQ